MSKKSKKKAEAAKKENNPKEQTKTPVVHNRLRPERKVMNNPKSERQQNYYYANQAKLLEQKKAYRKGIKEGTIVPKTKDGSSSPRVYKKKYLTDEDRHEAKLQSNRNWYQKNKANILDYQSKYNEQKNAKAREKRKQQILDEWEKFNQDLGNR